MTHAQKKREDACVKGHHMQDLRTEHGPAGQGQLLLRAGCLCSIPSIPSGFSDLLRTAMPGITVETLPVETLELVVSYLGQSDRAYSPSLPCLHLFS